MADGYRGYMFFSQGNVYIVDVHDADGIKRVEQWGTYSSSFGSITVFDEINKVTMKGRSSLFGIWWGGLGQEDVEYFIWRAPYMRWR